MQKLREAAKRFASEMARNAAARRQTPQDQNLQAQDLDKLIDQMEETARNGSREDAQAMLDQMQEMFENMRSARDDQESPAEREMRKQIGELEKLLRDQQALRDDTFRSDQKDRARKRAQRSQSAGQQDLQAHPDAGRLERSRPGRRQFGPDGQPGPGQGRPGPGRAEPARGIASRSCATGSPSCSAS